MFDAVTFNTKIYILLHNIGLVQCSQVLRVIVHKMAVLGWCSRILTVIVHKMTLIGIIFSGFICHG